jgi:hypothetical protein
MIEFLSGAKARTFTWWLTAYRSFDKYPLSNFTWLNDFIIRNYTVIEPDRLEPSGFRIYQIKDSTRRKPIELAGVQIEGQLGKPTVVGPQMVNTVPKQYLIEAAHSNQHLQRLEILVDGTVIDSVTFSPVQVKQARFTVPFDQLIPGDHKIEARATESSGASAYSDPCIVKNAPAVLPPDRLPEFGLPSHRFTLDSLVHHSPIRRKWPYGSWSTSLLCPCPLNLNISHKHPPRHPPWALWFP